MTTRQHRRDEPMTHVGRIMCATHVHAPVLTVSGQRGFADAAGGTTDCVTKLPKSLPIGLNRPGFRGGRLV